MSFKYHLTALAIFAIPLFSHAARVMPTSVGTGTGIRYTFTMGPMSLQAGPKGAGRIISVMHGSSQLLNMDTATATNYGSTFWPSPQSVWSWPPPRNIDGAGPYTVSLGSDSSITFAGLADSGTVKVRINKTYWANTTDSTFNFRYTIINTNTVAASWAPWEDTRIDTGGIYLFPRGTGGYPSDTITGDIAPFVVKDSTGLVWYQHKTASLPTGNCAGSACKFYADGSEGWFAHIDYNRLVHIKKFTDTPYSKKAPGVENEIEFYSGKPITATSFVEMEVQGPYTSIAPNDSLQWDMKWYLRKLPDSIAITVGNPAIAAFIRGVIAGPVSINGQTSSKAPGFSLGSTSRGVSLDMDKGANVSLSIVNSNGREINRVHSGRLSAGHHEFNLKAMPKGVYWLVLKDASRPGILGMRKLIWLQN